MTKQDFVQLLVSHDWYFERTEDPKMYKRGAEQRRRILEAKNSLGTDGEYLFQKYAKKIQPDAPIAVTATRSARVMPELICRSTGRIGTLVDKSPNGFSEVMFNGEMRSEFMRQSDYFLLD